MTGLEAIAHHHGFSMAAVGITIVFTALVTLSIIISQLHRLLMLWDNRKTWGSKVRELLRGAVKTSEEKPIPPLERDLHDINEEARQFNILIRAMGEPFSLPELIRMAQTCGLSHPHATAAHLIESNLITPDKKGFFLWNQEAYNQLGKRNRY